MAEVLDPLPVKGLLDANSDVAQIALAARALRKAGRHEQAQEMRDRFRTEPDTIKRDKIIFEYVTDADS